MSCVNMEQKERHAVCGNGIVLKMEDYMSKTLEEFEQYLDKMKNMNILIHFVLGHENMCTKTGTGRTY